MSNGHIVDEHFMTIPQECRSGKHSEPRYTYRHPAPVGVTAAAQRPILTPVPPRGRVLHPAVTIGTVASVLAIIAAAIALQGAVFGWW